MTEYKVGYFVGSLATTSINRNPVEGAHPIRAGRTPVHRDPDQRLPLYSHDYDARFPP